MEAICISLKVQSHCLHSTTVICCIQWTLQNLSWHDWSYTLIQIQKIAAANTSGEDISKVLLLAHQYLALACEAQCLEVLLGDVSLNHKPNPPILRRLVTCNTSECCTLKLNLHGKTKFQQIEMNLMVQKYNILGMTSGTLLLVHRWASTGLFFRRKSWPWNWQQISVELTRTHLSWYLVSLEALAQNTCWHAFK